MDLIIHLKYNYIYKQNILSIFNKEYKVITDLNVLNSHDKSYKSHEIKLIHNHYQLELIRLYNIMVNSIDRLRKQYDNITLNSNNIEYREKELYIINQLKQLQSKYISGINELKQKYTIDLSVINNDNQQNYLNEIIIRNPFN